METREYQFIFYRECFVVLLNEQTTVTGCGLAWNDPRTKVNLRKQKRLKVSAICSGHFWCCHWNDIWNRNSRCRYTLADPQLLQRSSAEGARSHGGPFQEPSKSPSKAQKSFGHVLAMSAVHLGQCEHNNRSLVCTKTAVPSAAWGGGLGKAVVKLLCGSYVVWKLYDLEPIQLQGLQHMFEWKRFPQCAGQCFEKEKVNETKESNASKRLPAASFTSCLARLEWYKQKTQEKMPNSGSTMRRCVAMFFSSLFQASCHGNMTHCQDCYWPMTAPTIDMWLVVRHLGNSENTLCEHELN